jgi:hypothetical protein
VVFVFGSFGGGAVTIGDFKTKGECTAFRRTVEAQVAPIDFGNLEII